MIEPPSKPIEYRPIEVEAIVDTKVDPVGIRITEEIGAIDQVPGVDHRTEANGGVVGDSKVNDLHVVSRVVAAEACIGGICAFRIGR